MRTREARFTVLVLTRPCYPNAAKESAPRERSDEREDMRIIRVRGLFELRERKTKGASEGGKGDIERHREYRSRAGSTAGTERRTVSMAFAIVGVEHAPFWMILEE